MLNMDVRKGDKTNEMQIYGFKFKLNLKVNIFM